MKSRKIVHVIGLNIYGINFYDFIKNNNKEILHNHTFVFLPPFKFEYNTNKFIKVIKLSKNDLIGYLRVFLVLLKSRQIFIHGLYDAKMIFLYSLLPKSKLKLYWVIWGGDLIDPYHMVKGFKGNFSRNKKNKVIGKIRNTIADPYDFEILQNQSYNPRENNLVHYYNSLEVKNSIPTKKTTYNVLLGNSSSISNNHKDAIDFLRNLINSSSISLTIPLSYGDGNPEEIEAYSKSLFPQETIILRDFISPDKYKLVLRQNIDIALFYFDHQIAFSNIAQLICYGKKVYLKPGSAPFKTLTSAGFNLYDVSAIKDEEDFFNINYEELGKNLALSKTYFAEETLFINWSKIFNKN